MPRGYAAGVCRRPPCPAHLSDKVVRRLSAHVAAKLLEPAATASAAAAGDSGGATLSSSNERPLEPREAMQCILDVHVLKDPSIVEENPTVQN